MKKKDLSHLLSLALLICYILLLSSCGDGINQGSYFSGKSEKPVSDFSVTKTPIVTMNSILQTMEKGQYVEGEILVKFRQRQMSYEALHRAMGGSVIKRFKMFPELEHVRLPKGVSVKEGIIRYMSDPLVEYAEPNYIRKISKTPNDPYFNQQWSLFNSGQPGSDIKATYAWDINTGGSDVIIAVLDTGMDYNHPDLISNRWINNGEIPDNGIDDDGNGKIDDRFGWDFTTCAKFDPVAGICSTPKVEDNNPLDDNGHGSHVSGIIGASGNNGSGIAGVMWNVRLMPLKILNTDGEGSIADEISALDYVVIMKGRGVNIRAINASFGGGTYSQSEYDAISRVNTAGIIFVAAAGNEGSDNDVTPSYPGNYNLPNIISVAATDQKDNLATFSNYGINTVHVAAPGVYILSTTLSGLGYGSGTSMATPHVTGLVGLLYSQYPEFSFQQIKSTILRYVDKISSLSGKIMSEGRINAYKALSSLLSPSNFGLKAVSSTSISMQWTDRATGEDGYRIERKIGNGSYSIIATLPANSISYNDDTVTDGLSYSYRVRAYNNIAESNYSNEVNVITPIMAPSNLNASAGVTEINLSWTDNSSSEEGFKIERKASDGVFVSIATVAPNTTTFTDTGLQQSTSYTYRVKAFNSIAGESLPAEITIKTASDSGGTGSSGGGGGGGGCSVITRGDSKKFDLSILLILPAIYIIRVLVRKFKT